MTAAFKNPFRPGAGHMPPHLAGRENAIAEITKYLDQEVILTNVVLTGLRGVGKTVLLETVKPLALGRSWYWVGTDLSESASISEENLCTRLLADLAVITSSFKIDRAEPGGIGFLASTHGPPGPMDFQALRRIFSETPGLIADKLKQTLELVWSRAHACSKSKGVVFAYDEAQNLSDHAAKDQYPLSMLLDVFQSLQKKGLPYLLVLTGLPTLFPKLVEARTYAERMFHVVSIDRLSDDASREAITKPTHGVEGCPQFTKDSVNTIVRESAGYPYFIQFICREVFDQMALQGKVHGRYHASVTAVVTKLDADFFAGRWARVTDRQRDLLTIVASLPNADGEFAVQDIVAMSRDSDRPFSASHVNQMLASLTAAGLIFKNRHGRYAFAVPLMANFIRRQPRESEGVA